MEGVFFCWLVVTLSRFKASNSGWGETKSNGGFHGGFNQKVGEWWFHFFLMFPLICDCLQAVPRGNQEEQRPAADRMVHMPRLQSAPPKQSITSRSSWPAPSLLELCIEECQTEGRADLPTTRPASASLRRSKSRDRIVRRD